MSDFFSKFIRIPVKRSINQGLSQCLRLSIIDLNFWDGKQIEEIHLPLDNFIIIRTDTKPTSQNLTK